jgi:hypothetical protein
VLPFPIKSFKKRGGAMNYLFMAIVYCETSFVSTDPEKVYQHFKSVEKQKGEDYITENDDYWISVIEMDTPEAKEISFENSKEFFDFMNGFKVDNSALERNFNNHI